MRAVVQRVSSASVTVGAECAGRIEAGFLVLLGVAAGDTSADAQCLARKISGLRIFEDQDGKMNRSLSDVGGSMLIVSQFTLLGDCRKGRRPSFVAAAPPEVADELYQEFVRVTAELGIPTQTGKFRQSMRVALLNEGPVTLILDSRDLM